MLCDVVWCCVMLYDVVLCCVMLGDVVWCCVMLCDGVWCCVMFFDVVWCCVMFCDVMCCCVLQCNVVWCCVMLCVLVWCCVMLFDVVWCCVMLCNVVWCCEMLCELGMRCWSEYIYCMHCIGVISSTLKFYNLWSSSQTKLNPQSMNLFRFSLKCFGWDNSVDSQGINCSINVSFEKTIYIIHHKSKLCSRKLGHVTSSTLKNAEKKYWQRKAEIRLYL